jgi:hypothetical protein
MEPLSQHVASTTTADVELLDSLSRMDIEPAAAPEQHSNDPAGTMSHQDRENLLDDPSVLLVVSHSGTACDYAHQCSAAKGIVSADRTRQLTEQANSYHRPYTIEIPTPVLAMASSAFRDSYGAISDVSNVPFDMGVILPGYVMCVLDWLVRSLRSKTPVSLIPEVAFMEGEDRWYWVYGHVIMRCLGMEHAENLQQFIIVLIDDDSLIAGKESYIRLLRLLQPSDPLVAHFAERSARQMAADTLVLSPTQCLDIGMSYPHFVTLVNECFKKDSQIK